MTERIHRLGVALALLLSFLAPLAAHSAQQTARAALPQVLDAAKKWQGDAILVHLSSLKIKDNGTATEWKYSFYSPRTQKRCVVTAGSGSVKLKEVRLGNFTEPLGEFIDSDKAMEIAKKNGLKGNQPSMSVTRPAGARAGGTTWIVTGGWKTGVDTIVSLDARTGKFSKRSVFGTD